MTLSAASAAVHGALPDACVNTTGATPPSFIGALPSARFRLPPEVPSGFSGTVAYGSCTGTPVAVFSATADGNTSSAVVAGSLSV
jgi:hypothetical protein